jgi:hypothetical protein
VGVDDDPTFELEIRETEPGAYGEEEEENKGEDAQSSEY